MSKYFKVTSEFDIGDEENPYVQYFKSKNINGVHRYLESYCCSCGLDYHEALEDGCFTIKEINVDDLFVDLEVKQ